MNNILTKLDWDVVQVGDIFIERDYGTEEVETQFVVVEKPNEVKLIVFNTRTEQEQAFTRTYTERIFSQNPEYRASPLIELEYHSIDGRRWFKKRGQNYFIQVFEEEE